MADNLDPNFIPPTSPQTPPPTPPGAVPPASLGYGTAVGSSPYLGTAPDPDSRNMGMLAHLLGIFTSWVGPLIIWMVKKDTSPFVNDQGKEALNWQITIAIGYIIVFILRFIPFVGCFMLLLFPAIYVVSLIFAIMGAMSASKGVAYRYPFALRLVK